MSEWVNYVKMYAEKNNIPYKQALKDASPSYKTRNEKVVEEVKTEIIKPDIKTKKKNDKKVVEKISVKF